MDIFVEIRAAEGGDEKGDGPVVVKKPSRSRTRAPKKAEGASAEG